MLVNKQNGYPADEKAASAAVVTGSPGVAAVEQLAALRPSPKDRSIVRQVAWKVVGPAMLSYASSAEDWFAKAVEYVEKVDRHIHGA